jgi:hypothetical protein
MTDPTMLKHLETVKEQIEAEQGKFSLFALFRRPFSSEWDLVVSAKWLTNEKMKGLSRVTASVYSKDFPQSQWGRIARIVTLNESDSRLRAIKNAVGTTDELRLIGHPEIEGLDVDEAYILRST